MKNLTRLAAITIALAGLSTSAHAAKKKPFDFSEFEGSYTGTGSLVVTPQALPINVSIKIAVPKSGRSAVVTISGSLTVSGSMVYPISNTLTFAANRSYSQSQILYGVLAPGVPISGTYSGKKALTFSGQTTYQSTSLVNQGTLTVRPQGKKHRRLTLTTVLSVPGQPLTYTTTLTAVAKVKPPKK